MTLLLYLLLTTFILIEIPLIIMLFYLWRHRAVDKKVSKIRQILFVVILTKVIFLLGQIIMITVSLIMPPYGIQVVIISYTVVALMLCAINWWALFELRKFS